MKKRKDDTEIIIEPWFNSSSSSLATKYDIESSVLAGFHEIKHNFDIFIQHSSWWVLKTIKSLHLSLVKYQPLKGGCSLHKLPIVVLRKKACLSINCDDNKCFIYAILAHMFPCTLHPGRINNYLAFMDVLNTDGLNFPVTLRQIERFEKNNKLSINVFMFQTVLYPIYVSKLKVTDKQKQIELLLSKKHYYLIRNLSRLIGTSFTKNTQQKFVCRYCLCCYRTADKLECHLRYCFKKGQQYTLPTKGSQIFFLNYRSQIKNPFVIYYDFECILEKPTDQTDSSNIKKEKCHVPIAVCAKRVCIDPQFNSELFHYVSKDCVKVFIQFLIEEHIEIESIQRHT